MLACASVLLTALGDRPGVHRVEADLEDQLRHDPMPPPDGVERLHHAGSGQVL